MTHIENVPHILQYGITHAHSPNANLRFVSIGDASLIGRRSSYLLGNGRRLGEYIPFYFGVRMPMLFVIQKGYNLVKPTRPEDVVYCVSSVHKIMEANLEFLFTDGHAVDSFTGEYGPDDIPNIDKILDKKAIDAKYWKDESDLDLKRRKEAEFLVLGDISVAAVLGFVVYNEAAQKKMIQLGVKEERIHINSNYYF